MLRQGLNNIQISALITVSIIGVTILTFPRLAVQKAGEAGILSTLLAGVLSIVLLFIMVILCKRFPDMTMIEFSQVILGRLIGKLYGAAFTMYCLSVVGFTLRAFADALKVLLLQRTPLEFIIITMLLVVLYQITQGIASISKVGEIFLPAIVIATGLLLFLNLRDVKMYYFRPMFSKGLIPIIMSVPNLFIAFLGYEIVFFLSPFLKNRKQLMKFSLLGLAIPIVVYTSLVIVNIGIGGSDIIKTLAYPTILLAKRITFPGSFAERFDILFIIFWILAAFTTIAVFYYMSAISVTRIVGLRNYKPFAFILAPFAYVIAILPQDVVQISTLSIVNGYLGTFLIACSLPMLIIAIIRKKEGKQPND